MALTNLQIIELFKFFQLPVASMIEFDLKTRLIMKKNRRIIDEVARDILSENPQDKVDPVVSEFEKDMYEAVLEYAQLDEKGDPISNRPGHITIKSEYMDKVEKIREDLTNSEKYKEALKKHDNLMLEWSSLLQADCEYLLDKINIEGINLPSGIKLTDNQWSALELLIEEPLEDDINEERVD